LARHIHKKPEKRKAIFCYMRREEGKTLAKAAREETAEIQEKRRKQKAWEPSHRVIWRGRGATGKKGCSIPQKGRKREDYFKGT